MRGIPFLHIAGTALLGVLAASCHEDPPPPNGDGPRTPPEQQTPASEPRSAEELQAEIDALADAKSLAGRLRHDALLQVQAGKAESETLEVHFFYSGPIERADRAFPGHLFAGTGDYLRAFERDVLADLKQSTGLEIDVHQTSLQEMRASEQPCVTIAYGASELLTVDTPEGEKPKLSFSLSLMATFMHDPASSPRQEIQFFESAQDRDWKEGESVRRAIYEEPIQAGRRSVAAWIGTLPTSAQG